MNNYKTQWTLRWYNPINYRWEELSFNDNHIIVSQLTNLKYRFNVKDIRKITWRCINNFSHTSFYTLAEIKKNGYKLTLGE